MRFANVLLCFAAFLTAAERAPGFSLPSENSAPVELSRYWGKVVLLDFWATWRYGCKTEIPWYMEFSKAYKKDGLVVIGVSMDDDGWKAVKPFIEGKKMKYPVVIGNDELGKRYGLDEMPLTLLIGRHGNIAYRHAGVVDKDKFEGELRNLRTAAH